jgi:hypothetical protein
MALNDRQRRANLIPLSPLSVCTMSVGCVRRKEKRNGGKYCRNFASHLTDD